MVKTHPTPTTPTHLECPTCKNTATLYVYGRASCLRCRRKMRATYREVKANATTQPPGYE